MSDKMLKKRKRCSNFSPDETRTLIPLVSRYIDTVECKKTDAGTWRAKDRAWERIAKDYNSTVAFARTKEQLKSKFEALKKEVKRDLKREDDTPLANPLLVQVKKLLRQSQSLSDTKFKEQLEDEESVIYEVEIPSSYNMAVSSEPEEGEPADGDAVSIEVLSHNDLSYNEIQNTQAPSKSQPPRRFMRRSLVRPRLEPGYLPRSVLMKAHEKQQEREEDYHRERMRLIKLEQRKLHLEILIKEAELATIKGF